MSFICITFICLENDDFFFKCFDFTSILCIKNSMNLFFEISNLIQILYYNSFWNSKETSSVFSYLIRWIIMYYLFSLFFSFELYFENNFWYFFQYLQFIVYVVMRYAFIRKPSAYSHKYKLTLNIFIFYTWVYFSKNKNCMWRARARNIKTKFCTQYSNTFQFFHEKTIINFNPKVVYGTERKILLQFPTKRHINRLSVGIAMPPK